MAETNLRTLVLRACANAEEIGYLFDEDNEQAAADIIDIDADVEEACWGVISEQSEDEFRAEVARYVAEYKAGARA